MDVVLILHNIRSLHNVGSLFRTADGAGVSKLFLVGITPEPLDRLGRMREPLRKVSLGAEQSVPWEHVRSFSQLAKKLKKEKYALCALEQSRQSISYAHLPKKIKKVALIVGNEVGGLPPSVLRLSDYILEIPMRGKKESLNVSVAGGVVLFRLQYP